MLTERSIAAIDLIPYACRYGGIAYRPNIAAAADWYVNSIQPLIDALD